MVDLVQTADLLARVEQRRVREVRGLRDRGGASRVSVEVYTEHDGPCRGVCGADRVELSERLPALATPGRPERNDDEVAAILGEPQVLPVRRLQREIGRCRAYC